MCGRYTIRAADGTPIGFRVGFTQHSNPKAWTKDRFNVAPTQEIPVITNVKPQEFQMFRWGLVPSWAEDPKKIPLMINARAETIAEKPSFRKSLASRRCLIPASGFYEWRKNPDGTKTPMFIRMKSDEPFAFAGLWEKWRDPVGHDLYSCTIITTAPNELMAGIHDRMPVIVRPEGYLDWLKAEEMNPDDAGAWLKPYAVAEMEAYPVRSLVNSVKNDGPELMERAG